MKRYYSITILAIIVITLLQGYNISLQYKDYLHSLLSNKIGQFDL